MPEEIFLTGATGFIGSSLLQKWLESSNAKINILVRSKRKETPEDRVKNILLEIFPDTNVSVFFSRIGIIEGDLSLERFGLKESEYTNLAKKVSNIIHCGAAVRFDLPIQDARKVNVGGTETILTFARKCYNLEKIDYIGTAYVAGKRKGIIKEYELDEKQEHNNTYEATKFESEKLVRATMKELPITIFRPSIVICDSNTGRVSSFSAFYRMLKMYMFNQLKAIPGYSSCLLDLVPVDYITDALYMLSQNTDSKGKCYHLTAGLDNITTLGEVRELSGKFFSKEKFALMPPDDFCGYVSKIENTLSEKEHDMVDEIKIYMPYLTGELKFDNSNTLKETNLKVPKVSNYFGKMCEYIIKSNLSK